MNFLQSHKINTKIKSILLFIFAFFLTTYTTTLSAQKKYTVVLDAGHGGKDPGNTGNGYLEKEIALNVTLLVGKELEKSDDIKVVYTRTTDEYPTLWQRGEIANNAKADLFVSIHCDSYAPRPEAHGAGTFVLGLRGNEKNLEIAKRENAYILKEDNYKDRYKGFDPNSAESVIGLSLMQEENLDKSLEIASLIQNNFKLDLKRVDRKVKQDNFQVLRETIMPSVLVELGFLTNKEEGRYLDSKKGQEQMSKAIADAIKGYVSNQKLNTVIDDVVQEKPPKTSTTSDVEFMVQIASGKSKLDTKPQNFKGLENINRIQIDGFYKYFFGATTSYEQVEKNLRIAQQQGYKTAFIVAFKNGKKIDVTDALK